MTNLISSLGLSLAQMSSLGINGQLAAQMFGEAEVEAFVNEVFVGNTTPFSGNAADAFDFAVEADQAIADLGIDFSYVDYLNQVNSILASTTGGSLDDLNFSLDNEGNFTGEFMGSSTTVNIWELMHQATEIAFS